MKRETFITAWAKELMLQDKVLGINTAKKFLNEFYDKVVGHSTEQPEGEIPTLDEADVLVKQTDYAIEAAHTDINPINWGDAAAFYIEGFKASSFQQPPKESGEGMTLRELRIKSITGTFIIGDCGIKEPPNWENHAKRLEHMILAGYFSTPTPALPDEGEETKQLLIDFCEVYAMGQFEDPDDIEGIVDWYLRVKEN